MAHPPVSSRSALPHAPDTAPPRTQSPCCYTAAMDDGATYCGECGKPLIRCMAFDECGGLLDDHGLCTVCVAPHVHLDAGAMTTARVGSALALPLSVANHSPVGRPLFVTGLWSREGDEPWQEHLLSWEHLHAGEARPVTLRADALERAGLHSVNVLLAVSSRWRWREERFAFTAAINLEIEGDTATAGPVVNIGGESAGHGNTVYIAGQDQADPRLTRTETALDLTLARAEREERRLKLRGLPDGPAIPRSATIDWRGFSPGDAPFTGPILSPDGLLAAGRSRSRQAGGPGDLRLLPEDHTGAIDDALGRLISRRHFELYIECDRLVLRVTGTGGVRVNGEAYGRDKTIPLADGDVISPLIGAPDAIALTTRFETAHGRVTAITLTRTPPSTRQGG